MTDKELPEDVDAPSSAYDAADLFSLWTFTWMSPLMTLGGTRPLVTRDVPSLSLSSQSTAILTRFEEAWELQLQRREPSFFSALTSAFGWRWIVSMSYASVFGIALIGSPQVVKKLLSWLENPTDDVSVGYGWAVGLWFCFFCVSSCVSQMYMSNTLMGTDMRTGVMLAVFSKATKL